MGSSGVVERNELCNLIPHSGLMCLIDKVEQWSEKHIVCYSDTHKAANNPLRSSDILPTSALIEYGAQAMAIHGGLIAQMSGNVIKQGYLAALRDVTMDDCDVSQIGHSLCIEAEQLMASEGNMIYNFCVKANAEILVSGRATVVAILDNEEC